jgi:uncharacterized RDD family membrane protein YckC
MIKDIFWLYKRPGFWSRLVAKVIDYCLFYIVATFISLFMPFYIEEYFYLIFGILLPIFWIPFEALLISKWATTPGKRLFGLQVRNHVGGKLPFWIALKRSFCIGVRPGLIKQKPISVRRKIIGCVICLISVFGAAFEQELSDYGTGYGRYNAVEGWHAYTSEKGGFRVLFPNNPQEEAKQLPLPDQNRTLKYNELTSYQNKKVYYSVSYMELPRKWKLAGTSRILSGALEGIVEHTPESELLMKHFTKHKNYRALDFHYSQSGEDVQGRLILVGTTLFRLTVSYPPSLAHKLQQEEFLNSFEVQS